MPEAHPAERVVDRREPGDDAQAALELGLQLGERDVRPRLDKPLELGLVRPEQRPAMAAKARRRRAARRAHPLYQLDRRRRADGKPSAASRIELPRSTARTIRWRRSWDIGAGIAQPRLSQPIWSNHRHRFHAIGICSKVKAWDAEKQRYHLTEVGLGGLAYRLKPEAQGAEPVHSICPSCYQNQKSRFFSLIAQADMNCFDVMGAESTFASSRSRCS